MIRVLTFLLTLLLAIPAYGTLTQPTRVRYGANCYLYTMCVAGTSADGDCQDAAGASIVSRKLVQGGSHVAYIKPDAAGRTCTVNIREAVLDDSDTAVPADALTEVKATLTCGTSGKQVDLTGPGAAIWFDLSGAMGAGSVTGYLLSCSESSQD